jgi:hypothetical protein
MSISASLVRRVADETGNDSHHPSPLLRGIDWRFVLPSPPSGTFESLVLLGGPEDLARTIIESGVARRVSRVIPTDASADLVVRLSDASVSLVDAAECLAPTGVIYAEIRRPSRSHLRSHPRRIRRLLSRVGLHEPRVYWCPPDFEDHKAYVPLDSAGSHRWYCANFPVGRLTSLTSMFGPLAIESAARHIAVTAVGPGARGRSASVLAHPEVPMHLRRHDLDVVVFAPGRKRVVLLPFEPRESVPVAAVKLTRSPVRAEKTLAEQKALCAIHERVDATIGRSVPQSLGCLTWNGLTVGMESTVSGRPLNMWPLRRTPDRRSIAEFVRVAEWLANFNRQTEVDRQPWNLSPYSRAVEAMLSDYVTEFSVDHRVRAFLEAVCESSRQLGGEYLPIVWCHGDFTGRNINSDAVGLAVFDWANARHGLAGMDLLEFVFAWTGHLRQVDSDAEWVSTFSDVFVAPNLNDPLVRASHRAVHSYMDQMQIDSRFVPLILVTLWISRALHYQRGARVRGSTPYLRRARLFSEYVSMLSRRPEILFLTSETPSPVSITGDAA